MNVIPPIDITDAMFTSSLAVETAPAAYNAATTYAWDISTGVYAGKKLLVGGQENEPHDVTFSSDGTKAYIVGVSYDTIYQYTLATPWDISTAVYASKSLSVTVQDTAPTGLAFSSDGTKVYIIGATNDTIYQYTLSTAWDISTGVYATKSLSVAAQDTSPNGIAFSSDGAKVYVLGALNDTIYQYTLATPWDISTGAYATKSLSVTAQEGTPRGIAISADGTKAWVCGDNNKTIYQYTLGTAWDISTGTYATKSLLVSAKDTLPYGLAVSSDGTKVYIIGATTDTIYQYDLVAPTVSVASVSFSWDVDAGTYANKSLAVWLQDGSPIGLAFSADGTKAYAVGDTTNTIYQYTLSTAWDISTGSYASKSLSVAAQDTSPTGLVISSDGTKAYVLGDTNDTVYQYTLATPWDISTGTYATKSMSAAAQDTSVYGLAFSADGTKAYVMGNVNNAIYQYTLTVAWDLSTGSYATKSLSVVAQEASIPTGIAFSADGAKVYAIGFTSLTIYQYTLATPWDISTGSYGGKSLSISAKTVKSYGLAFSSDGGYAFVLDGVPGGGTGAIYQYAFPASTGVVTVYRSIQATNVGHTPASSPTYWQNIGETYPVYNVAFAYALSDKVIDATNHLTYESLVAGNIGNALTDTTKWLELGPTNKWAAFDLLRNTRTIVPLHLEIVITPGVRADSIALMDMVADSARVMVLRGKEIFYDYTEDFAERSATDWADYDYPVLPTNPGVVLFDLPVEYDLATGVYAAKSLSVAAQDNDGHEIAFSSDGTKAYLLGISTDTIYQYTLSTAWDISTGTYASKSLSVAAQETTPLGLAFSADGTKVYVVGAINDTVYQYTLSTAWDISTGAYASKSLSVAAQETSPQGLAFSADGTKAYVVGATNRTIYQYILSTAWDISTGAYASKSLSVTTQESVPRTLIFSADGTKTWVCGDTGKAIYQYTLSTAWDVSTGAYASKSLSVAAQESSPTGLAISGDGSKLYVVGGTNDTIYQYTLPPDDASSSVVKVEFYKATGNVEVGACVLGNSVYIGEIQSPAEADVLNFSTVTRDFAGGTGVIVQRRNVPKTIQQTLVPNTRINAIRALRDYLNATPAVWVGLDDHYDARFDVLLILGFYKRFTIRVASIEQSIIDLELEEI